MRIIPRPRIKIARRFFILRRWKCEWGTTGWGKCPSEAYWNWFEKLNSPI